MEQDNVISAKTHRDDYFDKYPDAEHDECGDPEPCVKRIYGKAHAYTVYDADFICMQPVSVCHKCWNRPMPEEATK